MFSKIPWTSHQADHESDEQSLTTVLETAEGRTELLLLIAKCTASMRKTVTDTFDAEQVGRSAEPVPGASSTKEESSLNSKDEVARTEEVSKERARKDYERRVEELAADSMQELKQAAISYFDGWRDKVLGRVGEALNNKQAIEKQKKESQPEISRAPLKRLDEDSQDELSIQALRKLYPPRKTALTELDEPRRVLILHSLLLLLLSLERYPAESRVLLLQITSSLHLPLKYLTEDESKVAHGLLDAAHKQMSADKETKGKAEQDSSARKWKVGLATVAGAAIIGVTGGLAAPLIAAGVGTVMGGLGLGATVTASYLGALAGSAPLVGVLFGAYGGRMTGQMIDHYAKEVSDFAFIPIRKSSASGDEQGIRRLRVAIGISGWLTEESDIVQPWRVIGSGIEAFALRWELEALMNLGNSITIYVKSAAWGWAKKEIISRTMFGALFAGLWPLGLMKVARVVDNPFSVARARSDKAGQVLADALINKVQGERPVTLMGYSLGARIIYSCLMSLAERRAFGLVESVVLAGTPTPSDAIAWRKMRSVVSGRLVNVYSSNDYLLGFLYRTSSLQYGVAGLQAIECVAGIENVAVTDLVGGHLRYRYLIGTVLKKIGMEDIDVVEVDKEEAELQIQQEKEEAENKREERDPAVVVEGEDANDEAKGDVEAKQLENEIEKKNEESTINRLSTKMRGAELGRTT